MLYAAICAAKCPRIDCGGEMRPGIALQNTYRGVPDFAGHEVVTVSPGGAGELIQCLKCDKCGYSIGGNAQHKR